MATHSKSLVKVLPFAGRPVEKTPGHWVFARVGKTVLCPGGPVLSTWALEYVILPGSGAVESASGLGVTVSAIIEVGPVSYVGMERDPNTSARVNAIASGMGRCMNANTAETGLPDKSTDVVIDEAILSMREEKAKRAIMSEATRILRPNDRHVIHELGMHPDSITGEPTTEVRRVLTCVINVNVRPLTAVGWGRALEEVGLVMEETHTVPMALLKPDRMIADEGVLGALRVMRSVARDKDLRERVTTMARTFRRYDRHLCGVTIVARESKGS